MNMSKTVKGFLIQYSSFVNQTSALNVNTTDEELPLHFKNQSIASDVHLKSKSRQVKVKPSQVK